MVIIPREKPIIESLNSYYIDIRKFLEHYQGEMDSGCIHFKSPSIEGVLFFDEDELLNGIFSEKGRELEGTGALDRLIEAAADSNFLISIYEIDPERIYFWSNISSSEEVYKDLSTEFTELEGLIKNMSSEHLTGYIDVSIAEGDEGGLLFFNNGEIIGGSYSWEKGDLNGSMENQDLLISKAKESGGVFNVRRIPLKAEKEEQVDESDIPVESGTDLPSDVFTLLEEMMIIFEKLVQTDKKQKPGISTLLKKKLVEKADEYPFLDPFSAEFEYADQKITFVGDADDDDLANGVIETIKELADELGILKLLTNELIPWSRKYSKELAKIGISF